MEIEAQLKHLITDQDGRLSLHKLGNLAAQIILGVAVVFGYFVYHMPITYLFIYMGVVSGNGVFLKGAEYIDKSSGKDFGVTMSKYHKMVQDLFSQFVDIATNTPPTISGTTTDNPSTTKKPNPASGPKSDSTK